MCSADEVALVNTVYGTNCCTCSAAGALGVINNREVVYYGNSTVWTSLFTFAAADTSVRTRLACYDTLIVA